MSGLLQMENRSESKCSIGHTQNWFRTLTQQRLSITLAASRDGGGAAPPLGVVGVGGGGITGGQLPGRQYGGPEAGFFFRSTNPAQGAQGGGLGSLKEFYKKNIRHFARPIPKPPAQDPQGGPQGVFQVEKKPVRESRLPSRNLKRYDMEK